MTDRAPALGKPVLVRGTLVGIDLATDTARVEIAAGIVSVPRDRVLDGSASADDPIAETRWREHRDANVSRGISFNGISKRDFMAGYAAAAA